MALGMAHIRRHMSLDPHLKPRLIAAVRQRHDALAGSAGLNEEVFDALVLLAAGSFTPDAVADGFQKVTALNQTMDQGRRQRLLKLGFCEATAAELSSLHTRNFM